MEYIIVMDVSGDISAEFAQENDVRFIPMEYSLGGEMKVSTAPESREQLHLFYDGQRGGDLTKTSQISPYMYEEYISPMLQEGKSVLYVCLSSGLSTTYQSSLLARETLLEKHAGVEFLPFDSLSAAGGMGVLVERAIRNRKAGMTLQENYDDLCKARDTICGWLMVQDLDYLKRGGRISAGTAFVGSVLNFRPIIAVNKEGKLDNFDKKRGNKAAMESILKLVQENAVQNSADTIYVGDGDDDELGSYMADRVREICPGVTVKRTGVSPIIGAHTGPGMVCVFMIGK